MNYNVKYYKTPEDVSNCSRCNLSTGKTIQSHCKVPFQQAILAIYCTYPGAYEENTGLSLNPNSTSNNAGSFLHRSLTEIFNGSNDPLLWQYIPFTSYVIFGNVIRCNPYHDRKNPKKVGTSHIAKCSYWLDKDLALMDSRIPILVSGSEAVKSFFGHKATISEYRNVNNLKFRNHPVIVIPNLVTGAKSDNYIINPQNKNQPLIDEPIFGSNAWFLKRDFLKLKELVKEFLVEKSS